MVDQERVDRLLARVAADLRELAGYRRRGTELLDDRTELAAAKYYFITAIEGCARVAQHLIAAEGWLVAESNADAVRRLGSQGVLDMSTAESVATAVGFRNILVHEYSSATWSHVALPGVSCEPHGAMWHFGSAAGHRQPVRGGVEVDPDGVTVADLPGASSTVWTYA